MLCGLICFRCVRLYLAFYLLSEFDSLLVLVMLVVLRQVCGVYVVMIVILVNLTFLFELYLFRVGFDRFLLCFDFVLGGFVKFCDLVICGV